MKFSWPFITVATTILFVSTCLGKAPSGPWDVFNYAPSNKTVGAVSVHSTSGSVSGATELVNNAAGNATFSGNGSYVVLDFGKEVNTVQNLEFNRKIYTP